MSKQFPELVRSELSRWQIERKEVQQVYDLASRFLLG